MRRALLFPLLLVAVVQISCKSANTSAPTDKTKHARPLTPHPWPMVHHDAQRSGGSMDLPFQEAPPLLPTTLKLPGMIHHHNAPVIARGGLICVGSVGTALGMSDEADGVYCVTRAQDDTLRLVFMVETSSDAHHVSLGPSLLFAGTPGGELVAARLATGEVAWTASLSGPITASPLIPSPTSGVVVIATHHGDIVALDQRTGETRWRASLKRAHVVTQGLALHDDLAIATTSEGLVVALDVASGEEQWRHAVAALPVQEDTHLDHAVEPRKARIEASPVVLPSGLAVITYMRGGEPQTTPPILALDASTGNLEWEASARTPHHSSWHDQRVPPVFVEDRLLFVEPHSTLLNAIDAKDGSMLFLSSRPSCILSQRSSPVHASDLSYIPRHDGTLYAASQGYGISPWFVFPHHPEQRDPRDLDYFATFRDAYDQGGDKPCLMHPPGGSGFIATPAIATDGAIVTVITNGTMLLYPPALRDTPLE